MKTPRISVLLAVLNGAPFLLQQLNSISEQSLLPDELIVCDDASTDDSWDILQRYAATAPFEVKLLKNENTIGYTHNFVRCLEMAQGEIIFFCDQDDVWLPKKIEAVVQKMESQSHTLLVIHDGKLVDENLMWHGAYKLEQVKTLYATDRFVSGSLTAIRQSLARLALPIPEPIRHDAWIHALALALDVREIEPRSLQLIRRHARNASRGQSSTLTPFTRWRGVLSRGKTRDHSFWQEEACLDREVFLRLQSRAQEVAPHVPENLCARLQVLMQRAHRIERWLNWPGSRFFFKFL